MTRFVQRAAQAEGYEIVDAEQRAVSWAERGLTLRQACEEITGWTPEHGDVDGNNTEWYVAFMVAGFAGAVTAGTPMAEVLEILVA